VRRVSRDNGEEIDSWILQARRLHGDIEASKAKADEIIRLGEEERQLEQELEDATTQFRLLVSEIRFNETLSGMLGQLQLVGSMLSRVEQDLDGGKLDYSIEILNSAEDALGKLALSEETIVMGLMKQKAKHLRSALVKKIEESWGNLLEVNLKDGEVSVKDTAGKGV
jgi:protein transport protein DSL1/ZW10